MADEDITPQLLLQAYANGIFPMSESRDDPDVFWVDPHHRGVFPLEGFHVSRSLAKAIRQENYQITVDTNFKGVLDGCSERSETWINDTIRSLYSALHGMRKAHSLEVWDGEDLIGGVYGVVLGGAFFGESMFSRRKNGSKIALTYLIHLLRKAGFILFDTQFVTPHLQSLGAIEITRADYHEDLATAIALDVDFKTVPIPTAQEILQEMTQTS
jgi:leucyl/phenylalanyl-tRNA--protein transferase